MKRTKIFVGLAAIALAIGGFLTTKANKKFTGFNVAFNGTLIPAGTFQVTTVDFTSNSATSTKTVIVITATNKTKLATLWTSGNAHKVYRK